MDPNQYIPERSAKTLQELAPYVGQWVVWSDDGRTMLAHAPDLESLAANAKRRANGPIHGTHSLLRLEDEGRSAGGAAAHRPVAGHGAEAAV
jgi:hypothetical protein